MAIATTLIVYFQRLVASCTNLFLCAYKKVVTIVVRVTIVTNPVMTACRQPPYSGCFYTSQPMAEAPSTAAEAPSRPLTRN